MTNSICRSKNPATCPYHGSRAYEVSHMNLDAAQRNMRAAKTLGEVEAADKELQEAVTKVDSTEKGYRLLERNVIFAESQNDFANEVALKRRLALADTERALEKKDNKLTSASSNLFANKFGSILKTNPTLDTSISNTFSWEYYDDLNPANEEVTPENLTDLRKALKHGQGLKNDGVRVVRINSKNLSKSVYEQADEVQVWGPRDGRPLDIHVINGFAKIRVMSGNVIVNAESSSGNVIEVEESANVVAIIGTNKKLSAEVKLGGKIIVAPREEGRGSLHGDGQIDIAPTVFEHSVRKFTTKN